MYVAMGWLIMFAIKPLAAALPDAGIYWLIIGGLSYTVGAILYAIKAIPYNHAIFIFLYYSVVSAILWRFTPTSFIKSHNFTGCG